MLPKIFADFNNCDPSGCVRLNCIGTYEDLAKKGLTLSENMIIVLTDYDEFELRAIVVFSKEENIWVGRLV
jgi:hypothetical protein